MEVKSSKPGSKLRKHAQTASLLDGDAWATIKWYDEVLQVPLAALVALGDRATTSGVLAAGKRHKAQGITNFGAGQLSGWV